MFVVKSIDETIELIQKHFQKYPLRLLKIKLEDALNYVCSQTIISKEDVPHFHRSIVDGYAVDFQSVKLATISSPTILKCKGEVIMGKSSLAEVDKKSTVFVPTGGQLPKGANSVVMIEECEKLGEEIIINKSVSMWENTLLKGSDVCKGEAIITKNTLITPLVIGVLKALGVKEIEVYDKLSATIISTGDELVGDKEILEIGEIRDINTYTIANLLKNKNFTINKTEIIRDDFNEYKQSILNGFKESDIVFSSGGSSVGEKDYTFAILKSIKAEVLVHGVNIKPGKPTIIAKYKNKLFLGLPGQPTSAFMVLNTFINEIVNTIFGTEYLLPTPYFLAKLDTNVNSPSGRRMYQLVTISKDINNKLIATPLFAKSGMILSLKKANGYIIINESQEGLMQGQVVQVFRLGD